DAEVKIFLKASVKERALRRHKENKEKGFESNLKQLEKEIAQRDELDINRESSPLIQAEDAIAIDTTAMSISEVTDNILHYIRKFLNHQIHGILKKETDAQLNDDNST